jgi:hypothetical protein
MLQYLFNDIVRQGFRQDVTHQSNNRLFLGFNGTLAVGVLPVSAFASGHTFHVQQLHQVCSICLAYLAEGSYFLCGNCLKLVSHWLVAAARLT